MSKWIIETFNNQCTESELWYFIEDNLTISSYPAPMYWITEREIKNLRKKNNILLAMQGKTMVGCIIVKGSQIEILCVKRWYRKRGIGAGLIKHIEDLWKQNKRRRYIRVDSVKDFKAKGFYDRMGFVVYRHGLEDYTWHMQKGLNYA